MTTTIVNAPLAPSTLILAYKIARQVKADKQVDLAPFGLIDPDSIWIIWIKLTVHERAEFLEHSLFAAATGVKGGWELNEWTAKQYEETKREMAELVELKAELKEKFDESLRGN